MTKRGTTSSATLTCTSFYFLFLLFLLLLFIFFFVVVFLFFCMAADFVYTKIQFETKKQQCKRECGEKSKERVGQRRDWDDAGEVPMAAFPSDSG